MTANNSLEGLTLTLVATGGMNSLGWNIASHLILNSDLTHEGILGDKDGITQLQIYNRDPRKTRSLKQHLNTLLKLNDALSQRKNEKAFSIKRIEKIEEAAQSSDVMLISYDTVPGIDRRNALKTTSKRAKSLNSNIPVLREWQSAFKNYEGLMVFLTNPSDYMAYFGIDILGLDKDQIVGFNHVDTSRLRDEFQYITKDAIEELAGRTLSEEEKTTAMDALSELNNYTAFMLGNHSADSFGFFSNMTYGQSQIPWNSHPVLADEKVKKGIVQLIHKKARELSEIIDGPNANCIPPIIDVIRGIVTGEGVFEMAYLLELSEKLEQKIKRRYNAEVKGVCTGVPVIFKKDEKKRRAEIADEFKDCKGQFYIANTEEKEKFETILERNATQIVEATKLKKKEGEYRFLEESNLLIIRDILSDTLMLKETKKIDSIKNPSLLVFEKEKELHVKEKQAHYDCKPVITAIDTNKNILAAVSCQARKTIHIWEFPYITTETTNQSPCIKQIVSTDIGPMQNGNNINHILLGEKEVYLAESNKIEKRKLDNLKEAKTASLKLDEEIWDIHKKDSSIFAACSKGIIEEFDEDLNKIHTYNTPKNDADIKKVKTIELRDKKYVAGINEEGQIYLWSGKNDSGNKILQTQSNCFDISAEFLGNQEILSIYYITKDTVLAIAQFNPASKKIIKSEITKINCNYEINEIKVSDSEVFLASDKRVKSFINKKELNLDYSPQNTFIDQIKIIKYQK